MLSVGLGEESSDASLQAQAYLRLAGEMLLDGNRSWLTMRVRGMSMLPTLRSGDTIVVQNLGDKRPQEGDILLVAREADYVTHRLLSIASNGYLLKGDNMLFPDAPVLRQQIIGQVVQIQRRKRQIDLTAPWRRNINRWIGKFSAIEAQTYSLYKVRYDSLPSAVQKIIRLLLRGISLPQYLLRYLIRL